MRSLLALFLLAATTAPGMGRADDGNGADAAGTALLECAKALRARAAEAGGVLSDHARIQTRARGVAVAEDVRVDFDGENRARAHWNDVTLWLDGTRLRAAQARSETYSEGEVSAPLLASILGLPATPLALLPQRALAAAMTRDEAVAAFAADSGDTPRVREIRSVREDGRSLLEVVVAHSGADERIYLDAKDHALLRREAARDGVKTVVHHRVAAPADRAANLEFAPGKRERVPDVLAALPLREGDPAPPFSCAALDGTAIGVASGAHAGGRGRAVVIEFWSTWSVPSRANLRVLDAFARAHRDEAAPLVVGVDVAEQTAGDDRAAAVREFWSAQGLGFPAVVDTDDTIRNRYRVRDLPVTVVIDTGGRILAVRDATGDDYARWLAETVDAATRAH